MNATILKQKKLLEMCLLALKNIEAFEEAGKPEEAGPSMEAYTRCMTMLFETALGSNEELAQEKLMQMMAAREEVAA